MQERPPAVCLQRPLASLALGQNHQRQQGSDWTLRCRLKSFHVQKDPLELEGRCGMVPTLVSVRRFRRILGRQRSRREGTDSQYLLMWRSHSTPLCQTAHISCAGDPGCETVHKDVQITVIDAV